MLHRSTTIIDGLTFSARIAPDAPASRTPIILVHGLSVSSRYIVPTAKQLAPVRRVFAPDLPGFGQSHKPPTVLDIPGLTRALRRWMRVYNLDRAVLVGNSMGCQIIAELAMWEPECVERAVFVGPTMDRAGRTVLEQARRLGVDGLREPLSSIVTQASDYLRAGPQRTLQTLRYALRDRIEDKLPHMPMPVLIVRGERDPIAPRRWCEELVRLLPNGTFLELADAPHAANYSAPGPLARAVLDFANTEAYDVSPRSSRNPDR